MFGEKAPILQAQEQLKIKPLKRKHTEHGKLPYNAAEREHKGDRQAV